MLPFQERHSKRFHITLQVSELAESIQEYSEILGEGPCCVIPGHLVLWRTGELNFLLRARPQQRTAVLQLGWEYDYLENTQRFKDCNQLSWLFFSTGIQDEAINRLDTDLEYYEDSDFLLELRNPSARWNLWASLVLVLGMAAFTVWNHDWLQGFFRPAIPEGALPELQSRYSASAQLKTVGKLLEAAGYQVSYLGQYAVAQHSLEASITVQIVNHQVLFNTYWILRNGAPKSLLSKSETQEHVNQINREAILCRYYLDKDGDFVVESWFPIPVLLLLESSSFSDTGENLRRLTREQSRLQWQKTLELWQLESLGWLQDSPLFGGDLEPKQSFSKSKGVDLEES